jgi:hypothetical protein
MLVRRLLSHTETTAVLTCQAQHDFRYVGQLAGSALRPRTAAPLLRQGRAWGRGVATWHQHHDEIDGLVLAATAIHDSLEEDAEQQRAAGLYLADEHDAARARLVGMLEHYAAHTEPLPITRPEHELNVPIPSRRGQRRSNAYRLQAFLDGLHADSHGRLWIVEYKLRGQLSSLAQITLSRQTRWAAWAWREQTGQDVTGVIVDERLNELPKPARILKNGTASHAKDQLTTPELYLQACRDTGVPALRETADALAQRRWQLREPIIFRAGELEEAAMQLVSAGRLIHQLDTHQLYPIRNPSPAHCGGCAFRDVCPDPTSADLVDALFERVPAKCDRVPEEVAA